MGSLKFENPAWLAHTVISTTGAGFYLIKETLKSAGWTAKSSGDGLATYDSSADCLTHSGTGAGGTDNPLAWIRLQASGSTRQLAIQVVTTTVDTTTNASQFEISYARTGTFALGSPSATQRPMSGDEQYLIGSGSAAAPRGIRLFNWHSSAPICLFGGGDKNSPFGFYFAGISTEATYPFVSAFSMMPVAADGVDPDPYVFYTSGDGTDVWYWSAGEMYGQGPLALLTRVRTWTRLGVASQKFQGAGATGWYNGTAGIPEDFDTNEIYGAVRGCVAMFHRVLTTGYGEPKGFNTIMAQVTGPQAIESGLLRTYSLSGSNDLIRVSSNVMPWNGTIPTVLPYSNGGAMHLWSADANYTGSGNSQITIYSGTYDSVRPNVSIISPSPGSNITRLQQITVDVTDNSGSFGRIILHGGYSGLAGVEPIHDGEVWNVRHYSGSLNTRQVIANGYRYTILRDGGWPGDISLTPYVIDGSGNENS